MAFQDLDPLSACVSVMVPTAGRPEFLRTALEGVRLQLGSAAIGEVVVSENAGDPRSAAVLKEFPELPARLRQTGGLPMVEHIYELLGEAKCPFVALLNDDDWWLPGHLAEAVSCLQGAPGARACLAASTFVSSERDNHPLYIHRSDALWLAAGRPAWNRTWRLDSPAVLALCWAYTPFHWSTMVARREGLLEALAVLRSALPPPYSADRLLMAELARSGPFLFRPIPSTYVRWHPGNWMKARHKKDLAEEHRRAGRIIERMASIENLNLSSVWRGWLAAMPGESEREVFERLSESFSEQELSDLGLREAFRVRPRRPRVVALRNIASNFKLLVAG
jgi:hypothetical protein